MLRSEIYRQIKELGLEAEIKIKFGDNYTRIPSVDLCKLIEKHQEQFSKCENKCVNPLNKVDPNKITDDGLRRAFVKLLATLQASDTLYPEEVEDILKEL